MHVWTYVWWMVLHGGFLDRGDSSRDSGSKNAGDDLVNRPCVADGVAANGSEGHVGVRVCAAFHIYISDCVVQLRLIGVDNADLALRGEGLGELDRPTIVYVCMYV